MRRAILFALCLLPMTSGAASATTPFQPDRIDRLPLKKLEAEAKRAIPRGVQGTCYGCASPYMQRLSRELVERHFPDWSQGWAACIVSRESGWNPGAISRTDDHGLAQFNRPSHPWVNTYRLRVDPGYAVRMFVLLSRSGNNRQPWAGGSHSC